MIVKVRAHLSEGKVTRGSAVLLGAGRLVTNCHVTAIARDLEVVHNGRSWRAEIEAQDLTHDLCILSAPGLAGVKANLSGSVTVGQKVFAAGFFNDKRFAVTAGRIVALHDYDGAAVIQVSSQFDTGASGGGLFDEDGRLIGVLTFKARAGGAFHFALPVQWVSNLNGPGREHNSAATLAFWQQPPEKQPFFLHAISLELNQKWDALAALGEHWTKKNPMNPRAWSALETAFRQLQRLDDAMLARGEAQRLRCIQARRELLDADAARLTSAMTEAACVGQAVPAELSSIGQ